MDQRFLAVDTNADEAVCAVGFDGGLLGVDHVKHLDVVLVEGKAGEVAGVGVYEVFGDGIEFGHELCLGLRVGWYPQRARIVPRRWLRGRRGLRGAGV